MTHVGVPLTRLPILNRIFADVGEGIIPGVLLHPAGRLVHSKLLYRGNLVVYIVHVVVMGALAHGLLSAPLGSIAKFLALTIGTFAASNAIVSSARAVSSIAVPGSSR